MADRLPTAPTKIQELSHQTPNAALRDKAAASEHPAKPEFINTPRETVVGTFNNVLAQMKVTVGNKNVAVGRIIADTREFSEELNDFQSVSGELGMLNRDSTKENKPESREDYDSLKTDTEIDPNEGKLLRTDGLIKYLDQKIATSKEYAFHQDYQSEGYNKALQDAKQLETQKSVLEENSQPIPFDSLTDDQLNMLISTEISAVWTAGQQSTNPDTQARWKEDQVKAMRRLTRAKVLRLPPNQTPSWVQPIPGRQSEPARQGEPFNEQSRQEFSKSLKEQAEKARRPGSAIKQLYLPTALALLLASQAAGGAGKPEAVPGSPTPTGGPVPAEVNPDYNSPSQDLTPAPGGEAEPKPPIQLEQASVQVGSDYEGWLQHEIAKIADPTLAQKELAQGFPIPDNDPQLIAAVQKFIGEDPRLYGQLLALGYEGIRLNNGDTALLQANRGETYDSNKQYPPGPPQYDGNSSYKFGQPEINYLNTADVLAQLKSANQTPAVPLSN